MRERGKIRIPVRVTVLCAALLGVGWTLGCARYDEFAKGKDMREIAQRQVQNPERSEERTPVEGIGATTAADVTTNYHTNQSTQAQQSRQDRQRDNGLVDVR